MTLDQVLMWTGVAFAIAVFIVLLLWLIRWSAQGGQFKKNNVRLCGKIIIITGCDSDLGKATAIDLAHRGAKIYMACRNQKRSEEARQEIIRATGNSNVNFIHCDLASLSSVRAFVKEFLRLESRLDVLINNANCMFMPRTESKDGFEMHLAVNHLGHFLLTNLLLDTLKASFPSRVITLSSSVHKYGRINRLDLNMEKSYNQYQAYFQSKLANILFARSLAKRLLATGVCSNSLHPGIIRNSISIDAQRCIPLVNILISPLLLLMKTSKAGAQTTIMLAVDPELEQVSGRYFADCKIAIESECARDYEAAEWLWEISEKLTGLKDENV